MIRSLVAFVLGAVLGAGCAGGEEVRSGVDRICGPDVSRAPCARGVGQGVPYRFQLLTHCGIDWAYVDGRYWIPKPKVETPPEWAGIAEGTITLVARDQAVFEADSGGEARFVPAPVSYRPQPCA